MKYIVWETQNDIKIVLDQAVPELLIKTCKTSFWSITPLGYSNFRAVLSSSNLLHGAFITLVSIRVSILTSGKTIRAVASSHSRGWARWEHFLSLSSFFSSFRLSLYPQIFFIFFLILVFPSGPGHWLRHWKHDGPFTYAHTNWPYLSSLFLFSENVQNYWSDTTMISVAYRTLLEMFCVVKHHFAAFFITFQEHMAWQPCWI